MSFRPAIQRLTFWVVIATLLLTACTLASDQPPAGDPATVMPDTPVPLPTGTDTPQATETVIATATQAPVPVTPEEGAEPTDSGEDTNSPDPLCQRVPRPALLLIDRGDYFITNWISGDTCQFDFPGELPGLIQSGGEALYYHEMDFTSQDAVVMRLAPDGTATGLPFTETGSPDQFLHFVVSPDGQRIAWSTSRAGESGEPVSDLWLAGTDGEGQTQLLSGWPAAENRFVIPLRFSADGETLYISLQPIGVGGSWVSFSGRFDSLYAIPTSGEQPVEIFQCPAGSLLCIGDFSGDGEDLRIAYTDSAGKTIHVLAAGSEGSNQFSFPEADYLGYPSFGPGGELAFYVATIGEHADGYPIPQSGTIYLVPPPYEGQPQPVKSDDSIATLIGWLDPEYLVYNSIDPGGNWGTVVTSLSGEAMIWGPGPTQFITILR